MLMKIMPVASVFVQPINVREHFSRSCSRLRYARDLDDGCLDRRSDACCICVRAFWQNAVIALAIKFVFALAFSGVCAMAYRLLAKRRPNVRRESALIFVSLLLFSLLRLLLSQP
jgi:hypothetical protein